ncbi:hypothetical protein [Haladaptatus sp. DFWS20]|uniref:hypothetical protein n=1 Tax=Haladaptatus sp. DFWS20 TaxID=3403467 RepID=UPI003EBBCA8B
MGGFEPSDRDLQVRRGATWALAEVAQRDPAGACPVVERAGEAKTGTLRNRGRPACRTRTVH